MQASADQLRLLTDAAPIGIFQTDIENSYVYTNPRWTEITGIIGRGRRSDVTGTASSAPSSGPTVGRISPAATADRIRALPPIRDPASRAGPRGSCWSPRSPFRTSTAARPAGSGTLADVTAEAGAETAMSEARDKATEASRLKSDFLANMSHEIRTPMNGVIGMTDLLLETDLDARQRDYAQTVRNSGEALLAIINDILDFSKIEAGKLEVEDIEFDLRTIVDDVIDLLAGPAQAKDLELHRRHRELGPDRGHRRPWTGSPGPDEPHRQCHQVHPCR